MLKTLTLLIFFFKCTVYFSQSKIESPLDSVNKYLAIYDTIYSPKTANKYLYKAFSFAKELNKDSLLIEISSYLAYDNVLINNKMGFDKANNILLKAYKNKKDSTALSLYYQNKGWYFENNASVDSAYYYYNKAKIISKASQSNSIITIYYSLLENNLYAKDYLGVEELAIEIIGNKNFNDEYVFLAETYAFLGVVSSRLHNYDDALKYHQKGLKYVKKISDKSIRISEEINNTNNIGSTYLDQNKFNKSLYYFNEALKLDLNLKNNDIEMYAVLLVNKGVSEIKSGKIKYGLNNLNEALNIAEELKTDYIKVEILLELASYYKKIKNSTKAKEYVYNAMTLAKKTNFKQLKALKLSAEIYTGKKSIEFYEKYINLQEEIKKKEQTRKNKFARVRFETQKKEEENNALKQEGLIAKEKIKNEQNKKLSPNL